MHTNPPRGAAALDKALALFLRLIEDEGETALAALAAQADLPTSTAQRMVQAFLRRGLLRRVGRGRYAAGVRLAGMTGAVGPREALIAASRPPMGRLAKALGATVHLGVLEGDMVTYLVKAQGGGPDLLTSEMSQLEAYCSGIGKALLAHLPEAARSAYLAAGPFVALTPNTITDPDALAAIFQDIYVQGHALDNAELQENLFCVAVPVRSPRQEVLAALSASSRTDESRDLERLLKLKACAEEIQNRLRRDVGEAF